MRNLLFIYQRLRQTSLISPQKLGNFSAFSLKLPFRSLGIMRPNERFDKLLIIDPTKVPQHNKYNQPLGVAVPNWTSKPLPSSDPIVGKHCRLEALQHHHEKELSAILNDQSATSQYWRYFHGHFQKNAEQGDEVNKFLFKIPSDFEYPVRIAFAIIVDDAVKGVAEYRKIVPENGILGISVICSIDESQIAQEAGLLLMKRAFSLGYRRCEWRCNAFDEYSIDLAFKLGLNFECVLRNARVRKNHNVDELLLGITDYEWTDMEQLLTESMETNVPVAKVQHEKEKLKTKLNDLNITATVVDKKYNLQLGSSVPNWSLRPSPKEGLCKGRLCRLELLNHSHAEDLYHVYHQSPDDRDWTFLYATRPDSIEGFKQWFDGMAKVTNRVSVAIVCNETNKAVGTAAFLRIDQENGVLEIGSINYSDVLRRTVMGTEAVYLMMKTTFDLGYRRCMWRCDIFNERSKVAAYRYGFSFEGVFRQDVVIKGRNYDVALFSIIDKEWPKIDEAISKWLDPTNFGEDGKQLKRLDEYMT